MGSLGKPNLGFLLSWDPKETWALITWFVFAIYLHTRISKVGPVNDQRLLAFRFYYLDLLFRC
jgi:ABC-type transport system involved in cytochrome c biogenesis permease subunit